jgi:hypothetical protein
MGKNKKADFEYPFEHSEAINNSLGGISIHPVYTDYIYTHYKDKESFLTQLPEKKETAQGFHHEANGDFETV